MADQPSADKRYDYFTNLRVVRIYLNLDRARNKKVPAIPEKMGGQASRAYTIYMLESVLLIFVMLVIWFLARGAVFVPIHQSKIEIILRMAQIQPKQKIADLGSGDGRIVIAFARAGAEAHGFEINPLLVWWSRYKIRRAGLHSRAFIHFRSFWPANLSQFDIVTVFGIDYIMKRLGKKLRRELKPGAQVISFAFPIPDWQEERKERGVYVYTVEKQRKP